MRVVKSDYVSIFTDTSDEPVALLSVTDAMELRDSLIQAFPAQTVKTRGVRTGVGNKISDFITGFESGTEFTVLDVRKAMVAQGVPVKAQHINFLLKKLLLEGLLILIRKGQMPIKGVSAAVPGLFKRV